jgi:hypothetical protein
LDFWWWKDAVAGLKESWWLISPEGFGTIAMIVNFVCSIYCFLHQHHKMFKILWSTLEFLLVQVTTH